mmetsp:Transcript_24103/g.54097  ORF Transcript_24103/g.54097 Transcript_24103/m.54097 type:complete len:226 (+) Transcript_24103:546-1223(+)
MSRKPDLSLSKESNASRALATGSFTCVFWMVEASIWLLISSCTRSSASLAVRFDRNVSSEAKIRSSSMSRIKLESFFCLAAKIALKSSSKETMSTRFSLPRASGRENLQRSPKTRSCTCTSFFCAYSWVTWSPRRARASASRSISRRLTTTWETPPPTEESDSTTNTEESFLKTLETSLITLPLLSLACLCARLLTLIARFPSLTSSSSSFVFSSDALILVRNLL